MAGSVGLGSVRCGRRGWAWHGRFGKARLGEARHGVAGRVRRGMARSGWVGHGAAGRAWLGWARCGLTEAIVTDRVSAWVL